MKFLIKFTMCFLLVQVVRANEVPVCTGEKTAFDNRKEVAVKDPEDDTIILDNEYNATCKAVQDYKVCLGQNGDNATFTLLCGQVATTASKFDCDENNCTEVKAGVAATTTAVTNATVTAAGTTTASPTTGSSAPTVSSTGDVPSEQADTASGIELSMTLIGAAALLALARRPMLD